MNNENIKTNIWKVGLVALGLLCLFLLVISIKEMKSISYVGKDLPIMNAITVTGKGEAISIPDIATFSFGVSETAKVVTDAQTQATTKINAALKALKDAGVADKDVKTLSYNINPHYEYDQTGSICANYRPNPTSPCRPGTSVLTGYDVSQTIQVKVRDLTKAGTLFATIGALDVQNVNGLTFSIDDIDSVKADARNAAIKHAQEKAKLLASQLGVKLMRITSFNEDGDVPMYGYATDAVAPMMMKSQGATAAPSVPTGEQKITSNVSITYEIK